MVENLKKEKCGKQRKENCKKKNPNINGWSLCNIKGVSLRFMGGKFDEKQFFIIYFIAGSGTLYK